MVLFNFIFYALLKRWRKRKGKPKPKPKRKPRSEPKLTPQPNNSDVERNAEDDDVEIKPRPLISNVIMMWGIFEVLTIAVIITQNGSKRNDNYENFMSDLCKGRTDTCRKIIFKALAIKILSSVVLVIGAKYVS